MSLEQSRGRSVRVREEAARPEPLELELAARLEAKTQTRDEGRTVSETRISAGATAAMIRTASCTTAPRTASPAVATSRSRLSTVTDAGFQDVD